MPDQLTHIFPARVLTARAIRSEARSHFPSEADLLSRYLERFDADESPYFLRVEISNNSLDWYYTHMMTSSLENYAADAEAGVGLQDSHNARNLGYGRSLWGRYVSEPGSPPGWDRAARSGNRAAPAAPRPTVYERTLSAAYIIRGLRLNQASYATTDDFIRAVEAGAVEQISIGFGGGRETCDICGARYYSWDCPHIAGFDYDVEREGVQSTLMATVAINDARLLEYSAVYAGATPNAAVVRKAEMEAEGGRLSPKMAEIIEQRYRVRLLTRNWPGANTQPNESEVNMDEIKQIRAILGEAGAPEATDAIEAVRWAAGELARLRPLADQGERYKADLVEKALAEGVRALGNGFSEETYRGILAGSTIDTIERMRADWAAIANARYQGGRHTADEEQPAEQKPEPKPKRRHPDSAYKA